nr:tetratricopeptide repeat protein [Gemmatimonadaceae bacterium]
TRQWRELWRLEQSVESPATVTVGGGSKALLLEELAEFLRLAAQQRPLVLLLENMQWADSASWDALEHLIAHLESERILIALTFSGTLGDVTLERWTRIGTRPRHHEIRLTSLTRDDVKRWIESVTRTPDVGREVMSYLYRHSEGRPLVLGQLLRDLQESGALAVHDGEWRWRPVSELPAPVPFAVLIGRRLDRLALPERSVLELAAVVGRESDEALFLSPSAGASEAHTLLHQLVTDGFLWSTYDRDRAAYVVAHHEIAAAIRERIPPERLAALHDTVATALAGEGRGSLSEIAFHYERAAMLDRAHHYALRAADHALSSHETSAVAELLAAAERTAPSEAELADVRVRMASVAEVAGRYPDAEALCDLALAWYDSRADRLQLLRVKRMRALVRMKRGQAAQETLTELLSLEAEAKEADLHSERAATLLLVAELQWRLGDQKAAREVAEEAVRLAELGDDSALLGDACNRLGAIIYHDNRHRARDLYTKSLAIATALGDPYRKVRAFNNIGLLALLSNRWDEARGMLESAVEQARSAGLVESWGRAELNLGVLAGRIGDYEESERALSEALRLTALVQNSVEQLYATYNMAHLQRESDRIEDAADTYSLVRELAERIGQVEVQAGAIAGMGLCCFKLGDDEGARAALASCNPLVERLEEWFQGRELIEGLRLHVLISEGEVQNAAAVFERSLALAASSDVHGAAWLTSEFGEVLRAASCGVVEAAIELYASQPEALGNPKLRAKFAVLKRDT